MIRSQTKKQERKRDRQQIHLGGKRGPKKWTNPKKSEKKIQYVNKLNKKNYREAKGINTFIMYIKYKIIKTDIDS